jgi:hypothetical protein
MSQVLSGLRLGNNFSVLFGSGDPNLSTAFDVQSAAVDYAFFRLGSGNSSTWLYRCVTAGVVSNGVVITPAVWVAH